ncbi:MAG: hypothetical protein C4337_01235 [Armatimonadota bacterium]
MIRQSGSCALGGVSTPPLAVYVSVWLMTVVSVLAVRMAQVSLFPVMPFVVLVTVGVCISALLSRLRLSDTTRVVLGVIDGVFACLSLTAQPFFNAWAGIATDPAPEIYMSLWLMWYLVLRSWLMVSLRSVAFQSVPALALFGLIATYILASAVLWLFALFAMAMLFIMAVGHVYEGRTLHMPMRTGSLLKAAFGFGTLAVLFAFVLTPFLWLTVGRMVSGAIIGGPIRMNTNRSPTESAPDLMVGSGPVQLSKMPVMRVEIEGVSNYPYLRREVFDTYTGRGWNRSGDHSYTYQADEGGRIKLFVRRRPPESFRARARVHLLSGWHPAIYSPGFPIRIEAPISEVRFTPHHGSVDLKFPLKSGDSYTVTAYAPLPDPTLLHGRRAAFDPFRVPLSWMERPSLSASVKQLVNRLSAGLTSDYDKVVTFQKYIAQNCKYNLNVAPYPSDVDAVEYFLFYAREGGCIEFATALAVMCMAADMPARVVSGFLLKEIDPETGEYIVREEHRHMWTEVYFEEVGWVPFEATAGAEDISPRSDQQAANSKATASGKRSWERLILDAIIAIGALYLIYLLVPLRRREHRQPSEIFQRVVRPLLFSLRLAGAPPMRVGQTLTSYLAEVLPTLRTQYPRFAKSLEPIHEALSFWLYAPEPQVDRHQARRQIQQTQRVLWQEMGAWRLIRQAFCLGWRHTYGSPVLPTQG